jgi:hypothetical protein
MAGNVTLTNLKSAISNTDGFYGIWNLTRAMKAAGWIYKASGDGTNKDTTASPLNDAWGPGVLVQSSQLGTQTGASATIGTISSTHVQINGLTGMTDNSVGHGLQISGATNSTNNGTFTIIGYTSANTVTIFNPFAVSEATSLTWSERVSGTGASISSASGDEATLTGLSGLNSTTSLPHYITITNAANSVNNGTFRIVSIISATSCKIKNSSAVAETGSLTWVENSPTADFYPGTPLTSATAWINMQGPSTMKLPINGASTGTFVRGENITQTSSGAQGEIIGYLWDSTVSQGYLVVMPRINGTGSGPRGWTSGTTDTITGAISAATVTTFSTPIEFVREFVFWKAANLTQGWIAYQCVDQSSESTSRFSYLASNAAGVTASVAPAGGGTSNTFPSVGTMICIGATTNTYTDWDMYQTVPGSYGRQHAMVVNAIATTGTSSDGSFAYIQGRPDIGAAYNSGFIFSRCDNTEDGDVDPYIWYAGNGGGNYTGSRTSCTAGSNGDMWSYSGANLGSTQARGFRRRGFSSYDSFVQFSLVSLVAVMAIGDNSIFSLSYNMTDPENLACTFSSTKLREPIFVFTGAVGAKMRKGTIRWMFAVAGGNNLDTYDGKKWVQVGSYLSNGGYGTSPFVVGPWDGSSTPLQS